MRSATTSSVLGIAVVVVAAVGLVDAAVGRTWDLTVLFGVLALLGVALVAQRFGSRRSVTLRADLADELRGRALRTGEAQSAVNDRAVATYLVALDGPPGTDSAGEGTDSAGEGTGSVGDGTGSVGGATA